MALDKTTETHPSRQPLNVARTPPADGSSTVPGYPTDLAHCPFRRHRQNRDQASSLRTTSTIRNEKLSSAPLARVVSMIRAAQPSRSGCPAAPVSSSNDIIPLTPSEHSR